MKELILETKSLPHPSFISKENQLKKLNFNFQKTNLKPNATNVYSAITKPKTEISQQLMAKRPQLFLLQIQT